MSDTKQLRGPDVDWHVMMRAALNDGPVDAGVASLCLIARNFGIAADPRKVIRSVSPHDDTVHKEDILKLAHRLGLEARVVATDWKRLSKARLPAIACLDDGSFIVAMQMIDGKMLVQHPIRGRPHLLEAAEFNYLWNGELITVRRAPLTRTFYLRRLSAAASRYAG
jgi:subfamily B ATP-binding cassette protein HlyB/CyaB